MPESTPQPSQTKDEVWKTRAEAKRCLLSERTNLLPALELRQKFRIEPIDDENSIVYEISPGCTTAVPVRENEPYDIKTERSILEKMQNTSVQQADPLNNQKRPNQLQTDHRTHIPQVLEVDTARPNFSSYTNSMATPIQIQIILPLMGPLTQDGADDIKSWADNRGSRFSPAEEIKILRFIYINRGRDVAAGAAQTRFTRLLQSMSFMDPLLEERIKLKVSDKVKQRLTPLICNMTVEKAVLPPVNHLDLRFAPWAQYWLTPGWNGSYKKPKDWVDANDPALPNASADGSSASLSGMGTVNNPGTDSMTANTHLFGLNAPRGDMYSSIYGGVAAGYPNTLMYASKPSQAGMGSLSGSSSSSGVYINAPIYGSGPSVGGMGGANYDGTGSSISNIRKHREYVSSGVASSGQNTHSRRFVLAENEGLTSSADNRLTRPQLEQFYLAHGMISPPDAPNKIFNYSDRGYPKSAVAGSTTQRHGGQTIGFPIPSDMGSGTLHQQQFDAQQTINTPAFSDTDETIADPDVPMDTTNHTYTVYEPVNNAQYQKWKAQLISILKPYGLWELITGPCACVIPSKPVPYLLSLMNVTHAAAMQAQYTAQRQRYDDIQRQAKVWMLATLGPKCQDIVKTLDATRTLGVFEDTLKDY